MPTAAPKPPPKRAAGTLSPGYAANMQGVAAVDRAMSILVALEAAAGGSMSLTELSAATLLYKSTLLRLLVSLERGALVTRRADQRYALGPFAFRLGKSYEAHNPLEQRLAPIMRALVDEGTESPSFHVRHDATRRLCLIRFDSRHSTLDRVRAGDLLPIDRGAAGRILLAYGERGAATPSGTERIMVSRGERDPLCGAVAAPVFGAAGELVGALSLSGPLDRFSPEAIAWMSERLHAAAEQASRTLGADPAATPRAG